MPSNTLPPRRLCSLEPGWLLEDVLPSLGADGLDILKPCSRLGVDDGERVSSSVDVGFRLAWCLVSLPDAFGSTGTVFSFGGVSCASRRLSFNAAGEERVFEMLGLSNRTPTLLSSVGGVVLLDRAGVVARLLRADVEPTAGPSGANVGDLPAIDSPWIFFRARMLRAGGEDEI